MSSAFELVISLPTSQRASYLATTYGSDAAFRAELESLVAAHDGATAFLDELHADIIQPALAHDDLRDTQSPDHDAPRTDVVAPGDRIRHFVVHERIGSGGAGIVYRGRDTLLERDVAIKVLAPSVSGDAVARARLVREAQAASRLDDPHVCAIYAIESTADGALCIVMAFCAGGTLRDRLRSGLLTLDDVMTIANHLARGLASAHHAGIVHGDIKPANVGFGEGDVARLLDFGVAVHEHEAASLSGQGLIGTLPYLAPELWRGAPRSARADVWALGVTFFEMVTGRRPFTGADPETLAAAIIDGPLPPLARLDGTTPTPAFAAVIRRMLSAAPDDRPADGAAVLAALQAMPGTTVPVRDVQLPPDSEAARSLPTSAHRTRGVRTPLVALTVAAALAGAAWWTRRTPAAGVSPPAVEVVRTDEPLPTLAILPFSTRGGSDIAYLREGMVDLLTPAFDGTGLVRGIDPNTIIGAAGTDGATTLDSADARALAVRVKAHRYVVGSLVKSGRMLSFRASLRSIDGREIGRAFAAVDDTASLARGVDAIVRQLIASALLAPADTVAGIAAATTSSSRALRAFLDGERELRDARPAAAVENFQQAVAADSQFALAWYRLARAARWNEVESLSSSAAQRAYDLASTLPPRQQALIRAYHDLRFGSPTAAERRLAQMVRDYPTDVEAWMLLGETQFGSNPYRGRSIQDAGKAFQSVMALDPRNREVTVYLMDLAAKANRLGQLDTLYSMYFSPNSAGEQPGIRAAYMALYRRRIAGAPANTLPVDLRDDPAIARVGLQRIGNDLRDRSAARAYANTMAAAPTPDTRAEGLRALAALDVADGNWVAASSRFRIAEGLDPARGVDDRAFFALAPSVTIAVDSLRSLRNELLTRRVTPVDAGSGLTGREQRDVREYLLGMLSIRISDSTGLAGALRALATRSATPSRVAAPLLAALTGHRMLRGGDVAGALGAFQQAMLDLPTSLRARHPVLSQYPERLALADCLHRSGRSSESREWYRALLEGPGVTGVPFAAAAAAGQRGSGGS